MQLPDSSIQGLETPEQGRAAVWARRVVLTVVSAVVVAGALGFLGVRGGHRAVSEAGWTVRLDYAQIARAGLDVPWEVQVTHSGGFDGPIQLAVTGDYFDIYETQGFHPEPSKETRDGQTLFLEFDPPPDGETLVISYDAYIQPSSHRGAAGTLAVVDQGQRRAVVPFRTRLLP